MGPIVSLSFRLIELFARIIFVPLHWVFALSNISWRPETQTAGYDVQSHLCWADRLTGWREMMREPVYKIVPLSRPDTRTDPPWALTSVVSQLTFLAFELGEPRQENHSQRWSQHLCYVNILVSTNSSLALHKAWLFNTFSMRNFACHCLQSWARGNKGRQSSGDCLCVCLISCILLHYLIFTSDHSDVRPLSLLGKQNIVIIRNRLKIILWDLTSYQG